MDSQGALSDAQIADGFAGGNDRVIKRYLALAYLRNARFEESITKARKEGRDDPQGLRQSRPGQEQSPVPAGAVVGAVRSIHAVTTLKIRSAKKAANPTTANANQM